MIIGMGDSCHIQYVSTAAPVFIELPASKSLSNRALIIQHLSHKPFVILNLSEADDTVNLLANLSSGSSDLNVGAAGTNMRFLISYLSIIPGKWHLFGSERLNQRPVGELVSCLHLLGADIRYLGKEGFPPLSIYGKELDGGEVSISASISSQFISSLLMIAPVLKNGLQLHLVDSLVSLPYIKMTLGLMNYFGIKYSWEKQTISIQPQEYVSCDYRVEPDWSAAAFWYAFTAVTGRPVNIKELSLQSLQGDKRLAEYGKLLGVDTTSTDKGIVLSYTDTCSSRIELNLINEPDLFPVLAFTCVMLKIPALFTGLQTLNLKESPRIKCVALELSKLHVQLRAGEDDFEIIGFGELPDSIQFETYNDHRIAMAAAVIGLSGNHVTIEKPDVVTKSYPHFWNDLRLVGYRFNNG